MAGSRLYKIGDIFSRTTGLMRSGAMKLENKPLWYDIYEAFPPTLSPNFGRTRPDVEIKQLFYPEDLIRAKFFRKYGSPGTMNLNESRPVRKVSLCERFVSTYQALQEREPHLEEEDLMIRAERDLEKEGLYLDRKRRPDRTESASSEAMSEEAVTKSFITSADLPEDVLRKIKVADIFNVSPSEQSKKSSSAAAAAAADDATNLASITAAAAGISAIAASVSDVASSVTDAAAAISDTAATISDTAAGISDAASAGILSSSEPDKDSHQPSEFSREEEDKPVANSTDSEPKPVANSTDSEPKQN